MTSREDFRRINKKPLISAFLIFTTFLKTLPKHNVLLFFFCSSKTEGKLKNIEKPLLNVSLGRS